MKGLRNLYLNINNLNGTLPSLWFTMTSLNQIGLALNNLTGTLPSSWSTLSLTYSIGVSNNKVTGTHTLEHMNENSRMLDSIKACLMELESIRLSHPMDLSYIGHIPIHISAPLPFMSRLFQ
jgi:hypothetical protein